MSEWRRVAIEKLPELQNKISAAENPYAVWSELWLEMERIYAQETPDDSLIERLYEYASWCLWQPHNDTLRTAVVTCFYEHLPTHPRIRKGVARWLSEEEFTSLRPAFGYHLSEREIKDFAHEFSAQKHKQPSPAVECTTEKQK